MQHSTLSNDRIMRRGARERMFKILAALPLSCISHDRIDWRPSIRQPTSPPTDSDLMRVTPGIATGSGAQTATAAPTVAVPRYAQIAAMMASGFAVAGPGVRKGCA